MTIFITTSIYALHMYSLRAVKLWQCSSLCMHMSNIYQIKDLERGRCILIFLDILIEQSSLTQTSPPKAQEKVVQVVMHQNTLIEHLLLLNGLECI